MRRLLVIAGPSAVGKSTLMDRLFSGEAPALAERIGFDPAEAWLRCRSRTLPESGQSLPDRVLLHYDLRRPEAQGFGNGYESDPIWERFRDGWSITFLTLWAPSEILCQRIRRRRDPLKAQFVKIWKVGTVLKRWQRCRQIERQYQEPGWISQIYRGWFQFTATFPESERYIANVQHETAICVPQSEWDEQQDIPSGSPLGS